LKRFSQSASYSVADFIGLFYMNAIAYSHTKVHGYEQKKKPKIKFKAGCIEHLLKLRTLINNLSDRKIQSNVDWIFMPWLVSDIASVPVMDIMVELLCIRWLNKRLHWS